MDYHNQTKQATSGIGVGLAGSINCPTMAIEPPRQSEVSMQFNILNNELDMLEKSLNNLGARLAPVLSPSKPCDVKGQGQSSMSSDLAKLLQAYNNRLSTLIDVINDFSGRIEV